MGNGSILHKWEAFTTSSLIFSSRVPWLPRRGQNCWKFEEKWKRRNQKERQSVKRVQVTYPLLHKRSINKQSPFLLYTVCPFLLFYHLFLSRWVWGGGGSTATQQGRRGGRSDEELGRGRGFSSPTRGGSQGATVRGKFVPLSPILPSSLLLNWHWIFPYSPCILSWLSFFFFCFIFFFQGLSLLQRASLLWEEVRRLEERAQQLETEGWGKMKEAVAGSEVEGLYGLLWGVASHSHPLPSQPPLKKPHFAPCTTISQPPPQESTGPEVSNPAGQATGPASPAAPSALEEAIPAHMQPLQIQVGGIKQVYKCMVEGCKEGPSTSQVTICAHIRNVHLGVRLVCSLCSETFFNLDVLRCHKKPTLINIG